MRKTDECPHNAIRKSRDLYAENVYVCGNCSELFVVKAYEPPKITVEPMGSESKIPWGFRPRQA